MPTIKLFRRHDLKDAPLIALAGLGVGIFASILVGALVEAQPARQKRNARRTGRLGGRPVGWGSQGGPSSAKLRPSCFAMMSLNISSTQQCGVPRRWHALRGRERGHM
jgi:hypothetical protein